MESLSIPHIPIKLDEQDLIAGARQILEIIRPEWSKNNILFKLLTDGITNKLVGCTIKDELDEDAVLIRVYGNKTDLLIDRKTETKNIMLLNKVNLAPRLYATFANGVSYEFIPGFTTNVCTIKEPAIYHLVAAHMARLHLVEVPDSIRKPMLWDKMEKFLDLIPEPLTDPIKHQRLINEIGSKSTLRTEMDFVYNHLRATNNAVVFCHNDLLLANILYEERNRKINFIDFEYTAFNYQAFDIGNHFAEFAGVDTVDHSNFPDRDFQFSWLRTYLSVFKNTDEISELEIEELYIQVNKFALVSHLFWGTWAIIQAENSLIDFDFIGYGASRINEYLARKDKVLV